MSLRRLADLRAPEVADALSPASVLIQPVGAIEQHGPHLPLSVDTTILEGIVQRVATELPADVPAVFLPTQRIGKSNEHARYPGTLTLSVQTLINLWMEIGDCVAAAGVRKMVIFNSHGGQGTVGEIVARDLRVKHDMLVVATNTYSFGTPPGLFSASETQHGIHGGDKETSVVLALRPDLVDMDKARNFRSSAEKLVAETRHLSINARAKLAWQIQDLNPEGACGDASAATAGKGEAVIAHVAAQFIEMLRDLHATSPEWLAQKPLHV
jgi:creatinine amidohydrolase